MPDMTHHSGYASVLALSQYIKSARLYGIDPIPLLIAHGIDPGRLDDPHFRTELWRFEALVRDILIRSDDPLFGLNTARQVDLGTYNVLGYMSNHVSTLREMCEIIPAYEQIFGDMGTTRLGIAGDQACLHWTCRIWDRQVARHVTETTIGSWYGFVKQIIRIGVTPDGVSFAHAAPDDPARARALADHFDCQITWQASQNAILIRTAHLDLPNPNADPALVATLLGFADDILTRINRDLSTTDRLRRMLRSAPPGSDPARDAMARALGLSGRSLHRRLQAEGTGFQQLVDEARREAAMRDLATTDLPVSQIAAQLGYHEVRSFYRRFKVWTGQTVGEFRAGYRR